MQNISHNTQDNMGDYLSSYNAFLLTDDHNLHTQSDQYASSDLQLEYIEDKI